MKISDFRSRLIDDYSTYVRSFIDGWHSPHRRHSAIGYQSPVNYEQVRRETA